MEEGGVGARHGKYHDGSTLEAGPEGGLGPRADGVGAFQTERTARPEGRRKEGTGPRQGPRTGSVAAARSV